MLYRHEFLYDNERIIWPKSKKWLSLYLVLFEKKTKKFNEENT